VASLPPVSVLFAAFLGYNPMRSLLGPSLGTLSPARQAAVTGHAFFPGLISGPFHHGLSIVFTFALAMCLIAAAASWLRGSGAGIPMTPDLTISEMPAGEPETAPALAWNPEMIIEEDA
jgi:hypothetical protein